MRIYTGSYLGYTKGPAICFEDTSKSEDAIIINLVKDTNIIPFVGGHVSEKDLLKIKDYIDKYLKDRGYADI